jgi:hypothetical protein
VWAVGFAYGTFAGEPLVEHWDGTEWAVLLTPAEPDRYVAEPMSGLSVVSPTDIWAVGSSKHRWNGPSRPLALHGDGGKWTRVPLPNPWPEGAELSRVAAVSSIDVWAVGFRITTTGPHESIIEHWDGNAWSVVAGPTPGTESELSGVVAVSASDIWAVGAYHTEAIFHSLAQHWNGERWRVEPTPTLNVPSLFDIDGLGSGDLWAVGTSIHDHERTLVEHFGVPFCAVGVDNDGDGGADYPADLGCESSPDGSEFLGTGCDDGYDGDHDGLTDYPTDPECSGVEDRSERGTIQCDDELDNDGDGKIDFRVNGRGDPECTSPSDPSESAELADLRRDVSGLLLQFLDNTQFARVMSDVTAEVFGICTTVDATFLCDLSLSGDWVPRRLSSLEPLQHADIISGAFLVQYEGDIDTWDD